ncbi:MAG: PLD nuclease N-terminal domain-containing protein [Rhodobacteraceae bacterium]|nr:PLD nuclease N-terminal domain-containing protein [Paracoccaceae bacterium]
MEFIIGAIIFVADVYAIMKIFQSDATTTAKVIWIVIILVLPVIGFIAWLIAGPKPAQAGF